MKRIFEKIEKETSINVKDVKYFDVDFKNDEIIIEGIIGGVINWEKIAEINISFKKVENLKDKNKNKTNIEFFLEKLEKASGWDVEYEKVDDEKLIKEIKKRINKDISEDVNKIKNIIENISIPKTERIHIVREKTAVGVESVLYIDGEKVWSGFYSPYYINKVDYVDAEVVKEDGEWKLVKIVIKGSPEKNKEEYLWTKDLKIEFIDKE